MMSNNREPIVTVATITGIVSAVLALMVAFGVDFTKDQTTAIMGAVAVIAPLVVAFIARQWTVPVAKIDGDTSRPMAVVDRESIVTEALDRLEAASRPDDVDATLRQ